MNEPLLAAFLILTILVSGVGILVIANLAEKRAYLRPLLYGSLVATNLLYTARFVILAVFGDPRQIDKANTGLTVLVASLVGILCTLVLLTSVRRRLAAFFARPRQDDFGLSTAGFEPASMMHMTAIVYCLYLVGYTVLTFLIGGGLSGLASDFTAPTTSELLIQMALFVGVAVLGVGLGIRRSLGESLKRLGLRAPTVTELSMASTVAFLLFSTQFVIAYVWQMVTPENVIQQQTQLSELLNSSINTLTMAFLIAATAAIGEEIAFRGALQPIFGLWPTAIFFALTHIQYTLTPATLVIVIVGVGFGWVRQKYNTTTAIVTHFLYDFALTALLVYGRLLPNVIR
jgi:membrane protease YdiL (CAAX protease family)